MRTSTSCRFSEPFHARVRARGKIFTAAFYGLRIFCCKVVEFCGTQRESEMVETPSVRNAAQNREKLRPRAWRTQSAM